MRLLTILVAGAAFSAVLASPASANHSWGGYHWARSANPFTLKVGDNLSTPDWKSHLGTAGTDWTKSAVMDLTTVAGGHWFDPSTAHRLEATSGAPRGLI